MFIYIYNVWGKLEIYWGNLRYIIMLQHATCCNISDNWCCGNCCNCGVWTSLLLHMSWECNFLIWRPALDGMTPYFLWPGLKEDSWRKLHTHTYCSLFLMIFWLYIWLISNFIVSCYNSITQYISLYLSTSHYTSDDCIITCITSLSAHRDIIYIITFLLRVHVHTCT